MNVSTEGAKMPEMLPGMVSKKELRIHFRILTGKTLRKKVFPPEVLNKMNLTLEEYNNIRDFNPHQTAFIYDYYKITRLLA